MNWKEFLKPNKRKLIYGAIIGFIYGTVSTYLAFLIAFGADYAFRGSPILYLVYPMLLSGWTAGALIRTLGWVGLIVNGILWAGIGYMIVWIYDKVKKK
jgi:hypothetical protein